ncbi:MAG: polysaccharide biosynthesis C-terminal domain-containing protein [Candidatus Thorarchaeota archaeon]
MNKLNTDFDQPTSVASAINLAASLVNALVIGIVFLILVTLATPNQLGAYTGIIFIGEIGVLVAVLGWNETGSWQIARLLGREKKQTVPAASRGLLAAASFQAMIVLLFIIAFSQYLNEVFLKSSVGEPILSILGIGIILHTVGTVGFGILMGQHRIKAYSTFSLFSILVGQLSGLVLFYVMRDVLALAIGWTLGGVVHASSVFILDLLKKCEISIQWPDRKLIRYTFAIFFSHILLFFSRWIDRYLLIIFRTQREVGVYSLPITFWSFVSYIPLALYVSLIPKLIRAEEKGETEQFEDMLKTGVSMLIFSLIALSIFIVPLSEFIIGFVGGVEFIEGGRALQILTLGFPFYGISLILGGSLKAKGKAYLTAGSSLAGVICGVVMGLVLIPVFGLIGAACSSTLSHVISSILAGVFTRSSVSNWLDIRPQILLLVSSVPSLVLLFIAAQTSNVLFILSIVGVALILEFLMWRRLRVINPKWILLIEPLLPHQATTFIRRILLAECESDYSNPFSESSDA